MVLEYLSGGTLEERLPDGPPLPDEDTARIARQLAAGLAHAHSRGLVHRDLKPANVLFDGDANAKIADFGIARMAGGRSLTVAGTVLGTAATIAPEQAAGLPATPASDVYSFGVILFRLLTGRPPFVSSSAVELVRMHQEEPAPRVTSLRPDAPPVLAALADGALEKDPARRPRDGAALVAALTGTAAGATTAVTQVVAARRGRHARAAAASGDAAEERGGFRSRSLRSQSPCSSAAPRSPSWRRAPTTRRPRQPTRRCRSRPSHPPSTARRSTVRAGDDGDADRDDDGGADDRGRDHRRRHDHRSADDDARDHAPTDDGAADHDARRRRPPPADDRPDDRADRDDRRPLTTTAADDRPDRHDHRSR